MPPSEVRWVARLTPLTRSRPGQEGSDIHDVLRLPLGLDVWERHPDALIVAATEVRLSDIERRGLARVERMMTTDAYQRAHSPAQGDTEQGEGDS